MTTLQGVEPSAPADASAPDHRGSWIPTWSMVTTRFMELRRRKGIMITIFVVVIALPTVFLAIRLLLHAVDPKSYGVAGGANIFAGLVAGVMYVFGFIVAAMLGCTAGSIDLSEGMFRHLVVTGRSRLALYLARIPAGLAIIVSMVAVGFAIICLVCSFRHRHGQLRRRHSACWFVAAGLRQLGGDHWGTVICQFNFNGPNFGNVECGPNGFVGIAKNGVPGAPTSSAGQPTTAQLRAAAMKIAAQNYPDYAAIFLSPPISLMVGSGLWLLLETTIGFIVGLGLGSLLGQRTVSVILMIVLEIVLTPLLSRNRIPYLLNAQRGLVGVATGHLEPNGLITVVGSGGGPGGNLRLPETTTVAVIVILAWLVGWTVLGAWRMAKRDA